MNRPLGAQIKLKWECVSNLVEGEFFLAELTISNLSDAILPATGWALYFNTCRMIKPETVTGGLIAGQVSGDLFCLFPGADFAEMAPNTSRVIRFKSALWVISETDAPLGFYIVYNHGAPDEYAEVIGDPEIVPFARTEQCKRVALDNVPSMTPTLRFDENAGLSLLPVSEVARITPTPVESSFTDGCYVISADTLIVHGRGLENEAAFLQAALRDVSGCVLQRAASGLGITLQIGSVTVPDTGAPDEAYLLEIGVHGIVITGATAHGVANGIQSLRQLLPLEAYRNVMPLLAVPHGRVLDAPRFAYRGMMLDVVRHFSSKETVLRLLDCMALYKLNKFHFHVTDDEGWRVEIQSLPELTEFGAKRGFSVDEAECLCPSFGSGAMVTDSGGSGFYNRAEFIEILKFATQRHIEIIPEFNVPGHSRAAIKSMEIRYKHLMGQGRQVAAEQYLLTDFKDQSIYESVQLWHDNVICIAKESCYRFIETVLLEVQSMYEEAGAPLTTIHTGGDEVPHGAWEKSPLCQAFMKKQGMESIGQLQDYFLGRYRDILKKFGLVVGGWEEIALSRVPESVPAKFVPNPLFVDANFQPYVWNNAWGRGQEDFAYQLANAGYKVVLCNATNLYFDLGYAKDPKEPGYYWGGFIETRAAFEFCPLDIYTTATVDVLGNPVKPEVLAKMQRLTPTGSANVLGIQGQLWGENARSRERVEYLIMPRLLGLAERAWANEPGWTAITDKPTRDAKMAGDWNQFANRLGQRELPRLDGFLNGYGYRIPLPGIKIDDGKFHANLSAPGLAMRYTLDGQEPTTASALYCGPVPVASGVVKVAAFSTTGRKGRTAELTC